MTRCITKLTAPPGIVEGASPTGEARAQIKIRDNFTNSGPIIIKAKVRKAKPKDMPRCVSCGNRETGCYFNKCKERIFSAWIPKIKPKAKVRKVERPNACSECPVRDICSWHCGYGIKEVGNHNCKQAWSRLAAYMRGR